MEIKWVPIVLARSEYLKEYVKFVLNRIATSGFTLPTFLN